MMMARGFNKQEATIDDFMVSARGSKRTLPTAHNYRAATANTAKTANTGATSGMDSKNGGGFPSNLGMSKKVMSQHMVKRY
jgi:hypothetical protein